MTTSATTPLDPSLALAEMGGTSMLAEHVALVHYALLILL